MAPEVTYQNYQDLWDGGMTEDAFSASLPRATARVNARLALIDLSKLEGDDADTYRRAVCAACERIDDPQATSWSAGKASMTFSGSDAQAMSVGAVIEQVIAGTPLSYTGI